MVSYFESGSELLGRRAVRSEGRFDHSDFKTRRLVESEETPLTVSG